MKLQTTKKAIKNNFNTVISIGYCDAQYLLWFKNPFAYSVGVYGWACDYYQINNVCISTGYNPIGERVPYELLNELEHKAAEIIHDYSIEHKDKPALVESLLTQLIDSVKKTVE